MSCVSSAESTSQIKSLELRETRVRPKLCKQKKLALTLLAEWRRSTRPTGTSHQKWDKKVRSEYKDYKHYGKVHNLSYEAYNKYESQLGNTTEQRLTCASLAIQSAEDAFREAEARYSFMTSYSHAFPPVGIEGHINAFKTAAEMGLDAIDCFKRMVGAVKS
ncbi:hypothetical protein QQS21_000804 [Conoideocrella luteorostrata]|uniref:Uncharacterized protein n=1 Tax=Conoideocrella luteorostrata TaxID=1105319 RepID=A0AAJ0CY49_9HYPO|nr:hypothetical protein QQS21_000804 [Conoideocrella luteorostrata]